MIWKRYSDFQKSEGLFYRMMNVDYITKQIIKLAT